jgi:hypothetical protein
MTMILIAMNSEFALQVSDRRLSWNGSVVEEEHNKSFSLAIPGFRFTVAFTGLARIGTFRTADWLLDTLFRMGQIEHAPIRLIEQLAAALTHRFSTFADIKGLPLSQRRLDVTIVGYNYSEHPPRGVAAEVTNANDPHGAFRPIFSSEIRPSDKPWTWMGAFGNGGALDMEAIESIREHLSRGSSAGAVQGMLEKQIRDMADDHRSANTIGKQLDHILIFSDPTRPVLGGRSSAVVRRDFTMPAGIIIGPAGQVSVFKGLTVDSIGPNAMPLSIPRVHRNQPCPCGSKKKYRFCHGSSVYK